jgi:uncharacterized protein YqjF (DUF2071 family)
MLKIFLTAEWRKLAMVNYAVDPKLLLQYLPPKTEIDYWNETCYVSLVGFMFLKTKLKGIAIPFHSNFPEVNLRFYVRYKDGSEWRRGVVFIKEIVPKPALTFVANLIYNENYETMKMKYSWKEEESSIKVSYEWLKEKWNTLRLDASRIPTSIETGSEEEFITEHYWGYTKLNDDATSEYQVEHPRWNVYPVKANHVNVDFGKVYGSDFHFLKVEKPKSVFLAEGSEIVVRSGRRI